MLRPTHAEAPQLFWLCVLYKDFITQCFREVFTLLGESKCQWHPSPAWMPSVNKQGVSLAVLLLPADSLCQRQTRKCHLSADSCRCCIHIGTHRESPAAPHPATCSIMLSADPQTCHASPWQHFTIYLNRAGAWCVPGKLLHSAPFREDLSPGKEDNEAVFLFWLFKAVLSRRHSNGWIGLNELSSLSVKLRMVEICGMFRFCFKLQRLLNEYD